MKLLKKKIISRDILKEKIPITYKIKKYILPVIIIVLFAASVYMRLYNTDQPFGPVQGWNAGHYMIIAENFNKYGPLTPVSYENIVHYSVPPMYTWILRLSLFLEKSELVARMPGIIFGMLSILVIYFIGKEMYNKKFALLSSLIFSLLPIHILMSKAVSVDITLLFFMIMSLYFFIKFYKDNKLWHLILSSLFLALAILTKQPAAGLLFIYGFLLLRSRERMKISIIIILLLSLVPFIALGLVQPGFLGSISREGGELHFFPDQNIIILAYGLSPIIVALTIAGFYFGLKRKGWQSELMISWFLLYMAFFIIKMPSGHMQYLVPLLPAAAFLSAKGTEDIFIKTKPEANLRAFVNPVVYLKYFFLIILIASILLTNFVVLKVMYSYDTRFIELRDFLGPKLDENSRIFMINDGGAAPLVAYYLDRTVYNKYPGKGDSPQFIANKNKPIDYYHFEGASQEVLNKVAGYLITSPSGMPQNMQEWLASKKLLKRIDAQPIQAWPFTFQTQSIEIYEV